MKIRRYLRVPFPCPVECTGDGVFAKGSVTHISMGGWTIESPQPMRNGATLTLQISLPDEEKPLEVKQALVRWSQDGKFGLETKLIEEEEEKRLQRFIVTYVNTPARKVRR